MAMYLPVTNLYTYMYFAKGHLLFALLTVYWSKIVINTIRSMVEWMRDAGEVCYNSTYSMFSFVGIQSYVWWLRSYLFILSIGFS